MTTADIADTPVEEAWAEDEYLYRSVSRQAVIALVIALFAQLAWFLPVLSIIGAIAVVMAWLAWRQIRRYPEELTGSALAVVAGLLGVTAAVGGPTMLLLVGRFKVPEGYEVVTFDDLRPSKVEEARGLPIPSDVDKLNGKKVFIKGYVHPGVSSLKQIKTFVLVPDMKTCCFGGQPKLSDMVEVTVVEGDGVEYSYRRRGISGVFRVRPKPTKGPGGIQSGYYVLEADNIQ